MAITRHAIALGSRRQPPGVPTPEGLRFTSDGRIELQEPLGTAGDVEQAARLLDALLPAFDDPAVRVPGALRIAVARALGALDLPAYASLDDFLGAIQRFSAPDATAALRGVADRWAQTASGAIEAPSGSPSLTISDVRRARRSTGLTLTDISERSRIPVSLLRELEWGYFVNWPDGQYGRTQLIRYARAAGLDDHVVMRAVWPVLQEALRARAAAGPVARTDRSPGTVDPVEPVVETRLVPLTPRSPARAGSGTRRRTMILAGLAIPALIGIAALPMLILDREPPTETEVVSDRADAPPPTIPEPKARETEEGVPADATTEPTSSRPQRLPTATPSAPRAASDVAASPPGNATDPRPAALSADAAFSPAFASSGSAMFYHADAGSSSALMRADTDASGAVLRVTSIVDDSARNFHARPSPDGRLIAFDSDREGERAVYVADADGTSVRRVSGEGFGAVPSWSPDGRRLTFVRSEPDRPRVWNIWMVDLDTGATTRLTSHRVGQPWGAAWFPDGERIAYSHEDRLIVRSIEGGPERIYPSPRKGRLVRTPAVSPDGTKVMFQLYRDGAWMLDLADESMRRILTDPTAEEFTWSPDGRRVAYHSRKTGDWNVWMMAAR